MTSDNQLQTIDQPLPEKGGFLQILSSMSQNPDLNPDVIHGLIDAQERVMAKDAEIAFNQAMNKLQMEMPVIKKDGSVAYEKDGVSKQAFKFATYENIMKAVKPILQAHGFTVSFDTEMKEGGGAIVTGTLSHVQGHSKKASIPVALDTSGGKNNIQAMGSTFSYGKRYTLTMLLNIVTEGEDDDANAFNNLAIDEAQLAEVRRLIEETDTDTAAFCSHLKVESLAAITNKIYPKAVQDLKSKKKKLDSKKKAGAQ